MAVWQNVLIFSKGGLVTGHLRELAVLGERRSVALLKSFRGR